MQLDESRQRRGGESPRRCGGAAVPELSALQLPTLLAACPLQVRTCEQGFTNKCWQRQSKGSSAWAWLLACFIHNITNHVASDESRSLLDSSTTSPLASLPLDATLPRGGLSCSQSPSGSAHPQRHGPSSQMMQASRDRLPASHSSPVLKCALLLAISKDQQFIPLYLRSIMI